MFGFDDLTGKLASNSSSSNYIVRYDNDTGELVSRKESHGLACVFKIADNIKIQSGIGTQKEPFVLKK